MRPFLKWAGNKYKIMDRIKNVLPDGRRLIEPFAGSGAVFLNTDYHEYLLSDSNEDLINLYRQIQKEGLSFISYAKTFFTPENNNEEVYYGFRHEFNITNDVRRKSALFIYLNKHCYNGLCRYNMKGLFNTPFGKYFKPYFPERELRFFYDKSFSAEFIIQDFEAVMNNYEYGDVIYCDPPYIPLSPTSNFTSYSAGGFTVEQQLKLVRLAEDISDRGVTVVISNHGTEFVYDEYRKANIYSFDVQRFISTKGSRRIKVPEVLAVFG